MLLFWFDYLTADLLGVWMCIEKVQNKPTMILIQPLMLKSFKVELKMVSDYCYNT